VETASTYPAVEKILVRETALERDQQIPYKSLWGVVGGDDCAHRRDGNTAATA